LILADLLWIRIVYSLGCQVVIPAVTFKNKHVPQQRAATSAGAVPVDAPVFAATAASGQVTPSPTAAGSTKSLKGGVKGVTKRSYSSSSSSSSSSSIR
jgi:hypothetical protein